MSGVAAASFLSAWFVSSLVSANVIMDMQREVQRRSAGALGAAAAAALRPGATPTDVLRQFVRFLPAVAPNVEYAYVEAADGSILMHTDPAAERSPKGAWNPAPGTADFAKAASDAKGTVATAHVGAPADLDAFVARRVRSILLPSIVLFGAIGAVMSLILGFGLSHLMVRPIARLAEAAEEVGRGDLAVEVPVDSSDEVGELSGRFNDMVERLRSLDEMKAKFIASVSHDLRSPLAAIKMSLDFLLRDDADSDKILPQHRRTLATVVDGASRLSVFVSNILDAAKIDAGRMDYRLEPVRLETVARRLEELYAAAARERRIDVDLSVPADLPPALADAERLERVLANLLSNALKFTGPGGTIRLRARSDGGGLLLSVSDTGEGIPAEDLPRLFKPFEQAHGDGRDASGRHGTGLGLYIVKDSVESMGGTVSLESTYGKGTTVTVRLPAAGAAPAPAGPPPSGTVPPRPRAGRPAKVLVLDDDYASAEILKQILESKGYEPVASRDGRRTLELALREKPDAIVMDVQLRTAGGVDMMLALRENAATSKIPVLLCSAAPDLREIEPALAAGASCFLSKPVQAMELDLRIREALSGGS